MIYKLKSLEYAKEHFCLDCDGDGYWPTETEKEDPERHNECVRYITKDSFGDVVSNENESSSYSFTDSEFKFVFDWAKDIEITKEDYPEYFL